MVTMNFMDSYTRRLYRRKMPTLIITALVLFLVALIR